MVQENQAGPDQHNPQGPRRRFGQLIRFLGCFTTAKLLEYPVISCSRTQKAIDRSRSGPLPRWLQSVWRPVLGSEPLRAEWAKFLVWG